MITKKNFLGIDIGSVAIAIAITDEHNRIIHTSYAFHNGQITKNLQNLLSEIEVTRLIAIGYTSSAPSIIKQGKPIDSRIAYITAAKYFEMIASVSDYSIKDEALFNLGEIYDALGDNVKSIDAFKEILSDHTGSIYTEIAKEKVAGQIQS